MGDTQKNCMAKTSKTGKIPWKMAPFRGRCSSSPASIPRRQGHRPGAARKLQRRQLGFRWVQSNLRFCRKNRTESWLRVESLGFDCGFLMGFYRIHDDSWWLYDDYMMIMWWLYDDYMMCIMYSLHIPPSLPRGYTMIYWYISTSKCKV